MKFSAVVLALALGAATAFVPSTRMPRAAVKMSATAAAPAVESALATA
eukprot:CAMPEP_0119543616 /NCGR_PEP_ID=MMETSP1344-20130328/54224_1 /TAXON_ID=236787 /ORGANISM="Florenciella parvula, Strain CCMP2471" /LENGTH=47 /DNA_ID= /DNA_START= /DNA_END= /DNA_ORIENTATION=